MKIIVAPAPFKGTFSSVEIARMMTSAIHAYDFTIDVVNLPLSDGGEGFAECFLTRYGGVRVVVEAVDPHGMPFPSFYVRLPDGTAVVELAAVAGLHRAGSCPDPASATTYGVGTLMLAAARDGAKQILVGLGGSATNDAGCGLASALGVVFSDSEGKVFVPTGATLSRIAEIDVTALAPILAGIPIRIACDVTSPLSGRAGAALVYARQKGADDDMIRMLDDNLRAYSAFLRKRYHFDAEFPGAGAAGGTTVALRLFLHAEIERGIDTVLDMLGFDDVLCSADAVFTGEGTLDRQSLCGKAIDGVARRAHAKNVPCVAFAGRIVDVEPGMYPEGLTRAFALADPRAPLSEAVAKTPVRLAETIRSYLADGR
jgi:glycerate kinase